MTYVMKLTSATVVESHQLDDTFCSIIAGIEPVGPCHRLTFASRLASVKVINSNLAVKAKDLQPWRMTRG